MNKSDAPLIQKVDCFQIPVSNLDEALTFYRDRLEHDLIWRTATAAGLRMPGTDAEIVIQTERRRLEPNLLVESADRAAQRVVDAGGSVVAAPFDIPIGRCTIVKDPWGNQLVLFDASKGFLQTDPDGFVLLDEQGNPRVSN